MKLGIKRAYEPAEEKDGFRVLVDRLWPRGVTKEKLQADLWLKELGPSTELRKWFGHDPEKWEEFRRRYRKELAEKQDLLGQVEQHLKEGRVTLVYSAKDEEHNQAVVIQEYLERKRAK
ncbi:MAG: DUF488 domain-containing protein [Armatimonadia bacterium]